MKASFFKYNSLWIIVCDLAHFCIVLMETRLWNELGKILLLPFFKFLFYISIISLKFDFRRKFQLCIFSLILSQALTKVSWKFKIWHPPPTPPGVFRCRFCHGQIVSDQDQAVCNIPGRLIDQDYLNSHQALLSINDIDWLSMTHFRSIINYKAKGVRHVPLSCVSKSFFKSSFWP